MQLYMHIEHKPEGVVTASLIGWPEITAEGHTEEEVIRSLQQTLAMKLRDARIVPIDVPIESPWLQTAGMFKDDPFAEELDALIAEYRREIDAEEQAATSEDQAA
jgi:hypothetical protein